MSKKQRIDIDNMILRHAYDDLLLVDIGPKTVSFQHLKQVMLDKRWDVARHLWAGVKNPLTGAFTCFLREQMEQAVHRQDTQTTMFLKLTRVFEPSWDNNMIDMTTNFIVYNDLTNGNHVADNQDQALHRFWQSIGWPDDTTKITKLNSNHTAPAHLMQQLAVKGYIQSALVLAKKIGKKRTLDNVVGLIDHKHRYFHSDMSNEKLDAWIGGCYELWPQDVVAVLVEQKDKINPSMSLSKTLIARHNIAQSLATHAMNATHTTQSSPRKKI